MTRTFSKKQFIMGKTKEKSPPDKGDLGGSKKADKPLITICRQGPLNLFVFNLTPLILEPLTPFFKMQILLCYPPQQLIQK
jgi:hypothetical protein